jgi:hypothetical protein
MLEEPHLLQMGAAPATKRSLEDAARSMMCGKRPRLGQGPSMHETRLGRIESPRTVCLEETHYTRSKSGSGTAGNAAGTRGGTSRSSPSEMHLSMNRRDKRKAANRAIPSALFNLSTRSRSVGQPKKPLVQGHHGLSTITKISGQRSKRHPIECKPTRTHPQGDTKRAVGSSRKPARTSDGRFTSKKHVVSRTDTLRNLKASSRNKKPHKTNCLQTATASAIGCEGKPEARSKATSVDAGVVRSRYLCVRDRRPSTMTRGVEKRSLLRKAPAMYRDGSKMLDKVAENASSIRRLDVVALLHEYDSRAAQGFYDHMNLRAKSFVRMKQDISSKLDELDHKCFEEVDKDIEDDIRDYKKFLKSFAVLRENERLMRAQEKEQDKEDSIRLAYYEARRPKKAPVAVEVKALHQRGFWWVSDATFRRAGSRECCLGEACCLCRQETGMIRATEQLVLPRFRKIDLDESQQSSTESKCSRHSTRKSQVHERMVATRIALRELQSLVSFVEEYNMTAPFFDSNQAEIHMY